MNRVQIQLAMVFPGQGSQSMGMLAALAGIDVVRQTFVEASIILGYDLWELAEQGPEQKLNQTEYTQPVLLTAEIAIWRYWLAKHGPAPQLLAGHSLGEYSALVAAEALTFADALKIVEKRGRYMQQAVSEGIGAMAAIVGLKDNEINELCQQSIELDEVLSPANFNSIGQTVIAGHSIAVDRAIALAQTKGAKIAKRLPVSVPSHCQLMQAAADRLAKDLSKIAIRSPQIAVIHNYDVCQHPDPDAIRQALIRQLTDPVRWVETIQLMEDKNIHLIVECGPGKVLTGLNKRISTKINTYPTADLDLLRQAFAEICKEKLCH